MKFDQPLALSRHQAERALSSTDARVVREALVAIALNESDWRWAQERCLQLTHHRDVTVRAVAVTCIGHIARIHREVDLNAIRLRLDELILDAELAPFVENALEDIALFTTTDRS